MNGFFKNFLASLLALVVGGMLLFFFGIMLLAGIGASLMSKQVKAVAQNSVLKIDFTHPITDNPAAEQLNAFDIVYGGVSQSLALYDVLNSIENAAYDDNIKGIYLNPSAYGSIGLSNAGEIREALLGFRESGKFIISYADVYTQTAYYVCSVADQMYMNPEGNLTWLGLSTTVMYYKGLFDKLGLDAEIIRHGDYKSAVEPFLREDMSPENRMQLEELTGSIWTNILKGVSAEREISVEELDGYATDLAVVDAAGAMEKNMIDGLLYFGDVEAILAERAGSGEEPNTVSLSDYVASTLPGGKIGRNRVAVVYAEGEIVDGDQPQRGYVVSGALARELAEVRRDGDVKAVVVRINSPGGSALASEVIWKEMEALRQEKPLVVSMGGMAASGGYYIAAPADVIVANPGTLTGSIGVFGVLINGRNTLKDKLGITFDAAKTNPSADMASSLMGLGVRSLTDPERRKFEESIEQVYSTFVGHVAAGRNMSRDEVDNVGRGRVWSGASAIDIGLVDGRGGIQHAIELAADRAGIAHDYSVVSPSQPVDNLGLILQILSGQIGVRGGSDPLAEAFAEYRHLRSILSRQGVQAVIPYIPEIE